MNIDGAYKFNATAEIELQWLKRVCLRAFTEINVLLYDLIKGCDGTKQRSVYVPCFFKGVDWLRNVR